MVHSPAFSVARFFTMNAFSKAPQSPLLSDIKALEIQIRRGGGKSGIVSLKVNVGFVFCQRALMEERWLGSACDPLPYIHCFYVSE